MKVLLVNPPRKDASDVLRLPPLGLAYLAAMLERDGHRVKIIDAENLAWNWSSFEAEIKRQKADLIGFGSYTLTIENTFRAVKICRPHARYLVMGGYHVSVSGQEIFKECPALDFGIVGEAEFSFAALVNKLDEGADPGDVPGLVTPDRFNPSGNPISDLDSLPLPARHLLPNDLYYFQLLPGKKVTSLLTSRGCPYQCTYCDRSVFGSTWRARSPQSVLDEIEEAVRDLDIGFFIIGDDIFTMDKHRAQEICRGILDRGLEIQWKCHTRIDRVDEETLGWMKKAGCYMISYAIGSGNQSTLDFLRMGFSLSQVRQAVKMTRRAGIATMATFMLGVPVETFAQTMNTIEFARKIKAEVPCYNLCYPVRGTRLHEEAAALGLHTELKALGVPVVTSDNWPVEALRKIQSIAAREFSEIQRNAMKAQKKVLTAMSRPR